MITDFFEPKTQKRIAQEENDENMNVEKKQKMGWGFDLPSDWNKALTKEIQKEYYIKVFMIYLR